MGVEVDVLCAPGTGDQLLEHVLKILQNPPGETTVGSWMFPKDVHELESLDLSMCRIFFVCLLVFVHVYFGKNMFFDIDVMPQF